MNDGKPAASESDPAVVVSVEPGICGFPCTVSAQRSDKRMVSVVISGSGCKQVQRLAALLTQMSLKEIFMPLTRNPAYVAAEKAGCHASCVIPAAVLKAVEVALSMALPKAANIHFTNRDSRKGTVRNGSEL
jgi:hypothetical protein